LNSGNEDKQRRSADRFPMDGEVRFRVLERKSSEPFSLGRTINMSSKGVLFSTDQFLNAGRYLEISINWPAQLDSKVALKFVARGRVVRTGENCAAVQIHQYEFRTQAPQAPPALGWTASY
jgi:PilZ domain